jgi:hypothetical protein
MSLKEIFDMQGIFMYTIKQNDDNVKFWIWSGDTVLLS